MKIILIALALSTFLSWNIAAAQDVAAGKKIFKKCKACHRIGDNAKNAVGPVLTGVIGRPAGSFAGYKYSKTLKAANAAGLVWDQNKIADYIKNPKAYMKALLSNPKAKPKMMFKLKDAQKRKDVAAYIASFSQSADQNAGSNTAPATADTASTENQNPISVPAGGVCVQNASTSRYFFTVEGQDGVLLGKWLDPEQTLCTATIDGADKGTVNVFLSEDSLEGCSQIIPAGSVDKMLEYAEFDRCLWSSNTG